MHELCHIYLRCKPNIQLLVTMFDCIVTMDYCKGKEMYIRAHNLCLTDSCFSWTSVHLQKQEKQSKYESHYKSINY